MAGALEKSVFSIKPLRGELKQNRMQTPFTTSELQGLAAVLNFAIEQGGNATCAELKLPDTPDNRVFVQAVVGEDFELPEPVRGNFVLAADTIASFLNERVVAMIAGGTPPQSQPLLEVLALVRRQVESFGNETEGWARVAGSYDKSVIDRAAEQLTAEYRGTWRVHAFKNDAKEWTFNFSRS